MKKVLIIMIFLVSSIYAQQTALNSVLENIPIPNVQKAIDDANVL